jgi:hypothetical protein
VHPIGEFLEADSTLVPEETDDSTVERIKHRFFFGHIPILPRKNP